MAHLAPNPELWHAALRGEAEARERLLDQWLPVVVEWCFRLGGPRIDAEDAAQDVLMVLLSKMDTIRDREHMPGWLFGVTRKVLARHRSRAWVRRWVPGEAPDRADPARGPEQLHESAQLAQRLHEVLRTLPRSHREVLVLCDLEDRSLAEAADLLGIPVNTVKSRLHRARRRLRRAAERGGLFPSLDRVIDGGGE